MQSCGSEGLFFPVYLTYLPHDTIVRQQGASRADIDGSANDLNIDVSGASKVDADELNAQNVVVEASGASKANVYAIQSIDARASGASSIGCGRCLLSR